MDRNIPSQQMDHSEQQYGVDGNLLRDDSDRMSRMISNISNDSIRRLLTIASLGIDDEDFKIDDQELANLCESWDVSGFQDPLEDVDMELEPELDMMLQREGPNYSADYNTQRQQQQEQPQVYNPMATSYHLPTQRPPMTSMALDGMMHQERSLMGSFETKLAPEMDVQKPRVNLVLNSNTMMLDPTFCPRPSVTILPSQVIHAPQMRVSDATAQSTYPLRQMILPRETDGFAETAAVTDVHPITTGGGAMAPDATYSWSTNSNHHHQQHQQPSLPPTSYPSAYDSTQQRSNAMYDNSTVHCGPQTRPSATLSGEFSRMMMDTEEEPYRVGYYDYDDPFFLTTPYASQDTQPEGLAAYSRVESVDGFFADIHLKTSSEAPQRIDTPGDCLTGDDYTKDFTTDPKIIPSSCYKLQFSQSAELQKIEDMTEAEICNYVKSLAPHIQNNAMEEIVRETDFQTRLKKAEQKMQEHNEEMNRIRMDINTGRIDEKEGQDLMRRAYNRREAAGTRKRREERLVQAAIKKRTLEKICSWMREHLIGNLDLLRTTSNDSVRRCHSEGTKP